MMKKFSIRHLPVLEGGKLVGILTERDVTLVETLRGLNLEEVRVLDAMSPDVFTVGPKASVRQTATEMADHKYGSVVVVDGDHVAGVFTTVDALRALSLILARAEVTAAAL